MWTRIFFGYLCTIPALAEIFGGIPGFTHYHFNHHPQRRGHGGKHPRKIDKILFPVFQQGCLLFTEQGSCCEREIKLWFFFFSPKKRRNWLPVRIFFMDSPEGNAALWGKGAWGRAGRLGWALQGLELPGHTFPKHLNRSTQKKRETWHQNPPKTPVWKAGIGARCQLVSPLPSGQFSPFLSSSSSSISPPHGWANIPRLPRAWDPSGKGGAGAWEPSQVMQRCCCHPSSCQSKGAALLWAPIPSLQSPPGAVPFPSSLLLALHNSLNQIPLPKFPAWPEMLGKAFSSQLRKGLKIKKERFEQSGLFLSSQIPHFWLIFFDLFPWKAEDADSSLSGSEILNCIWFSDLLTGESLIYSQINPAEKLHVLTWNCQISGV